MFHLVFLRVYWQPVLNPSSASRFFAVGVLPAFFRKTATTNAGVLWFASSRRTKVDGPYLVAPVTDESHVAHLRFTDYWHNPLYFARGRFTNGRKLWSWGDSNPLPFDCQSNLRKGGGRLPPFLR